DYVTMAHAGHGSSPATSVAAKDATTSFKAPTNAASQDQHKPCSGPTCSRRSSLPPLAPVPPAPERIEQWGVAAAFDFGLQTDSHISPVGDVCWHAVDRSDPVFHPPR